MPIIDPWALAQGEREFFEEPEAPEEFEGILPQEVVPTEGYIPQLLTEISAWFTEMLEPGTPAFNLSSEEAAEFGIDFEEGFEDWQIDVRPFETGFTTELIDPEGGRINEAGEYISPEGELFTSDILQEIQEMNELWERIHQEMIIYTPILVKFEGEWINIQHPDAMQILVENFPNVFFKLLNQLGHTPDTEALLKSFEWDGTDIAKFFGERYQWTTKEITIPLINFTFNVPDVRWPSWLQTIVGGEYGTGGILGAIEWVSAPWNTFIFASVNFLSTVSGVEQTEVGKEFGEAIDGASLNPFVVFRDDFQDLAEEYAKETFPGWYRTVVDLANPIWWVSLGSGIGIAANAFKTIPLIGKSLRLLATATLRAERAMVWPISKPISLTFRGGVRVRSAVVNKVINANKYLEHPMMIPVSEKIIAGELVGNWQRSLIQGITQIPVAKIITRPVIEKALGWRILVKRNSMVMEEIVGRGTVLWGSIARRGPGAASVKGFQLKNIVSDPAKFFGLNERAFSSKMANRILPEFRGTKNVGTLEHILTSPEMYNWKGIERGQQFAKVFQEIQDEVLALLKREGVAPKHFQERWMHRVVEGLVDREGNLIPVRGAPGRRLTRRGRIGAKPAYEMPRRFETMAEGIAEGVKYNRDPLVSIGSYITEAYRTIADARFIEYTAKQLEAIGKGGVTPLEQLAKAFPELVESVTTREGRKLVTMSLLKAEELADVRHFESLLLAASRGQREFTEQTLRAIERRFPEQGARFRGLLEAREANLRATLEQGQDAIKEIKAQIARGDASAARQVATKPMELPSQQELVKAFRALPYEDRAAYRSFTTGQRSEIEMMIAEQADEIAGLKEFLATDPIATYRGMMGERYVGLTALLTRGGRWPETLTNKQAQLILMGREIKPTSLTKGGRVRWEYVVDELAEHFNMTEREFITHIESIRLAKVTISDLELLIADAGVRSKQLNNILKAIESVDIDPHYIPRPEPGMPEPGVKRDFWGYEHPVYPKGKGEITQLSMDEYAKLMELHQRAGLPPPDIALKPKIEGVKGLEGEAQVASIVYELPPMKTGSQLQMELDSLRTEIKAISEGRRISYQEAKREVAFRMEQARQPGISEGYIMQPFAGGKMYDQQIIDAFNKFFGHEGGSKVLKVTSDVAGILRITKAALDLSWYTIQGMPSWGLAHSYLITNPSIGAKLCGAWYKSFAYGMGSFLNPNIIGRYMAKNEANIMQRVVGFGGSTRTIDIFSALGGREGLGGFAARGMEKIPLKPYHRAEAAFFGASEIVADEFWRILSPKAIKAGKGFELARSLDLLRGITEAAAQGVPLTVRQLEQSLMWFAPNYTRACLTVLADIFRGGYTGEMARRALGGMMGAGALMYSSVVYSIATLQGKSHDEAMEAIANGFCVVKDPITGDWEWKPSAAFMSLGVENYNYKIGGFWYGLFRLAGNIDACISEVGDKERIDLIRIFKHGSFNKKDNPFIYWWYTRASPLTGMGFDLKDGSNFLGYPIETPTEYAAYILSRFEPIWMEAGINWMIPGVARDHEIPEGIAKIITPIAEIFGLASYPEGTWNKLYNNVNELLPEIDPELWEQYYPDEEEREKVLEALRAGKLGWGQLTETMQWRLRVMYPEVNELYQTALADTTLRDSDLWKEWTGRIDAEKAAYYEKGEYLWNRLLNGEIDTTAFREQWSEASGRYGYAIEDIEKEEKYDIIYNYFDKRAEEGDKYDWGIDLALKDYQRIMFDDYTDEHGDMDWDARDAAIEGFIETHGKDAYNLIRQMYADKKLLEGMQPELIRFWEDKDKIARDYWDLPWTDIKDLDEGDVPVEYFSLWQEYQDLETRAERADFIEAHPELGKDWRAEYRLSHSEQDAILALWGYGGKLQSMEAYNLVQQWSQELNIPLSQMGLGLPPETVIEDYFGYNEVLNKFSGSSAEAQLYRLEHPAWNEWGMSEEGHGWKAIEAHIESLKISVNWRELDYEYNEVPGETAELRAEQRQAVLEANPEYARDRRRREGWDHGFPGTMIEQFADYRLLGEAGYEQELYLLEHPEFYDTAKTLLEWREDTELKNIEWYKIAVEWAEFDTQYTDIMGATEEETRELRKAFLEANPKYAESRYRRDAYDYEFPDTMIENFVEYRMFGETGYEQELYLLENPEFYQTAKSLLEWEDADFKPIEWYRLSIQWKDMDDKYYALDDEESKIFLESNPTYQESKWQRDAYYNEFPNEQIDAFVGYRWAQQEGGWEDDWFLMEHPEFHQIAEELLGWTPRDFSKVPTREVAVIYDQYQTLPPGDKRLILRCQNQEFDAWLTKAFDYKPCYGTERCVPFGGAPPPEPTGPQAWGKDGWTKADVWEYLKYLKEHFPEWG